MARQFGEWQQIFEQAADVGLPPGELNVWRAMQATPSVRGRPTALMVRVHTEDGALRVQYSDMGIVVDSLEHMRRVEEWAARVVEAAFPELEDFAAGRQDPARAEAYVAAVVGPEVVPTAGRLAPMLLDIAKAGERARAALRRWARAEGLEAQLGEAMGLLSDALARVTSLAARGTFEVRYLGGLRPRRVHVAYVGVGCRPDARRSARAVTPADAVSEGWAVYVAASLVWRGALDGRLLSAAAWAARTFADWVEGHAADVLRRGAEAVEPFVRVAAVDARRRW